MNSKQRVRLTNAEWKNIIAIYDKGMNENKWNSFETFCNAIDSNQVEISEKSNVPHLTNRQEATFRKYYKQFGKVKKANDEKKEKFEREINAYLDKYQLTNDAPNTFYMDHQKVPHGHFKAEVENMAKDQDMTDFTKNKNWWK